jgi:isoquinoline 1-oxidoreductase beta subunit
MSTAENSLSFSTNRRELLKAGGALTIAIWVPTGNAAQAQVQGNSALEPNAFVRISPDNTVTVIAKHVELGQGAYTGLATIVAEELDADWHQVRVEGAPADAKRYNNTSWGPFQGTGGSSSIANSFEQLRNAGATARAMLVSAAAQRWRVPENEVSVEAGVVKHAASKHSATFGELAVDASKLPVPSAVRLKDPSQYKLIGKDIARVDAREKSTGTAIYTQDIKLPGLLTAVVAHPPRFGGKVKSFDDSAAKAVSGVVAVVPFETAARSGVAVVAKDFWSARKGRDALKISWDESHAFRGSTDDLWSQYRALADQPGDSARKDGDAEKALANAARVIEATYEVPYLAHATMEPLNCVARIGENECEIWNGEQFQTGDQFAVAKFLGIAPEKVQIHQLYAGGSFGRRANALSDYVVETVAIAKAAGLKTPLKLVWTREDDTHAGFYRPMFLHKIKAGLDANGKVIAWHHRIVGQSILAGTPFMGNAKIDPSSIEGAANLPYGIPNITVEAHSPIVGVPVQWWRSVGSTHSAYAVECFVDEIARATKKDPYALRRELLADKPRHLAVLDLLANKANWQKARQPDEIYGLALHESFGSVVGEVAKLRKTPNGLKLERVVCAVDCGLAVNPNVVAMQMESGIGYGLGATLTGAITLKDGLVEQSNFDDYSVLRMNQMPAVEVHILPSANKPSGVGEPGTPPIAPALVNALAAHSGQAIRRLPLSEQGVTLV